MNLQFNICSSLVSANYFMYHMLYTALKKINRCYSYNITMPFFTIFTYSLFTINIE